MNSVFRCLRSTISFKSRTFCTEPLQVVYKSAISTQNLYPNSNQKFITPDIPSTPSNRAFSGYIPVDQLTITYSRSSGPGGQNVNTVNSKVDLRFPVANASWISQDIKQKLLEKYKNRLNKEGYLVFRSELTRSQQLNLADCLQKLRTTIYSAMTTEPVVLPETQEKIRRRQEKACQERLKLKRERSHIKKDRQAPEVA